MTDDAQIVSEIETLGEKIKTAKAEIEKRISGQGRAVDLTLTGGNALIDKLIAAGLLPEEQAMGARMMMGLLAVPGQTPDTLNSRIEINAQGHVLANGQRIQ